MDHYDDEDGPTFLPSGVPVDLDEIQDGSPFDEEIPEYEVEKVNSFTADQSEDVVYRGMASDIAHGRAVVVAANLELDTITNEGKINKPRLDRKLEINLDRSKPSFAEMAGKPSFAENMKVGAMAPQVPFVLFKTHFYCGYADLNSVVNRVEEELDKIPEVAREFDKKKCSWHMICVETEGSARCHMTVNIYKASKSVRSHDGTSSFPYIVECHRLKGEHTVFRRVLGLLFENLSDIAVDRPSKSTTDTTNMDTLGHTSSVYDKPVSYDVLSEDSDDRKLEEEAVYSIAARVHEKPLQETRLLFARILADYTANEIQSGHASLCTSPEIIDALIALASGHQGLFGEEEVRYCAFLALSNLSRGTVQYKGALIDRGVVRLVIGTIKNGAYEDPHVCRECASILNNLCTGPMAKRVLKVIGHENAETIFPGLNTMADERVKFHLGMARQSLNNASAAVR